MNRVCPVCQLVEDEEHFLFDCNIYNDLRQRYIPERLYIQGGEERVIELLNSENKRELNNLGHYVFKALARRCELLKTR